MRAFRDFSHDCASEYGGVKLSRQCQDHQGVRVWLIKTMNIDDTCVFVFFELHQKQPFYIGLLGVGPPSVVETTPSAIKMRVEQFVFCEDILI